MANRLFSAAMSFYCSLMLSSAFATATQGLNLAAVGGAPAPAVVSPAAPAAEVVAQAPAAKKEEPLKEIAEKIRKEGKSGSVNKDMAVYLGLQATENIPAKGHGKRAPDGVVHIVLVTEKLDIIYMTSDKDNNKFVVLTDVTGTIRKAAYYDFKTGTPRVVPAAEAKKPFETEIAYWKEEAPKVLLAQNPPAEKKD